MTDILGVTEPLRAEGFAARFGKDILQWLGPASDGWQDFAVSWDDLPIDTYMADGGRYRRRRYAVFEIVDGKVHRAPHQPHYQSKSYNQLNGGLERWFDPIAAAIGTHPILQTLLQNLTELFERQHAGHAAPDAWHVEVHQFRIEATEGGQGQPTPEGAHRDGVDYAFVMMIGRRNVSSGVTEIFDSNSRSLGAFTLADPGDCVFLDDHRIFHGVTPIAPSDPMEMAIRDVLVITFTRASPTG